MILINDTKFTQSIAWRMESQDGSSTLCGPACFAYYPDGTIANVDFIDVAPGNSIVAFKEAGRGVEQGPVTDGEIDCAGAYFVSQLLDLHLAQMLAQDNTI